MYLSSIIVVFRVYNVRAKFLPKITRALNIIQYKCDAFYTTMIPIRKTSGDIIQFMSFGKKNVTKTYNAVEIFT